MNNKQIGRIGEEEACRYLKEHGYEILEQNWGSKWGEVDLVAKVSALKGANPPNRRAKRAPEGRRDLDKIYVFVEVKTKIGEDWGSPEEMINKKKLAQVQRMAETYEPARGQQSRVDVVAVVLNDDLSIKRLNHYECVY